MMVIVVFVTILLLKFRLPLDLFFAKLNGDFYDNLVDPGVTNQHLDSLILLDRASKTGSPVYYKSNAVLLTLSLINNSTVKCFGLFYFNSKCYQ